MKILSNHVFNYDEKRQINRNVRYSIVSNVIKNFSKILKANQ